MNTVIQANADKSPRSSDDKTQRRPGARILVLGIGNILRGDDGIGVHIARELRKYPRAGVLITEIGNAILEAVPLLAWADRVLVIDALMAQGPPGSIYFAPFERIVSQQGRDSLHELDIGTAMSFLPGGFLRPEVFVLGVEPACLDWSLNLSPEVLLALPHVVRSANEQLRQWRWAVGFRRGVHDE
jgi:hydrogenase maturation protease